MSGFPSGPSCTPFVYGYQRIQGCTKDVYEALPIFHLQLGSYMYQIQPAQYVDRLTDRDLCVFAIYGQTEKRWVLGSPFLNDYYQVYDMTRNQIGLVPSAYTNPNPSQATVPNAENIDELQSKIFVIAIGVTLYILSQIVRSMLTTKKEPQRPQPAPKPAENPVMMENQEEKMELLKE